MRNGQNNKRLRNRNNGGNNNNNRRGQNPMTRVFESNGPDIKIRGTASHIAEKYVQLARDARSSGDPVAAENYYQHAEHYFRLIAAAQEQFRQNQPQPRIDNDTLDNDDDGEGDFSNFGAEPGLVPVQQPQPYQQREQPQPYQPREQPQPREHRPQPQFVPREQPQPAAEGVDRLPSFITGPQPQLGPNAFEGNGGGGERFPPRRRRRPRGEPAAAQAVAPAPSGEDAGAGE
ncbi:DUF4167 domain-containing protein [Rhodopseudomonas palustris]|uniref:DUF4167 domain-containing protein n=1 Tax=Rhodopseudomonas palustris TaxID=1076 RepID=UPI000E5C214C|nr:DUF4167 domain-containing protein [Rhodopseudomonas palustris]QLH69812.1 DUF4167 domain-containing protein [Rhodopseudomonas palustris]RIA03371.1 DUF4167 domain-containing protein [Rhodopseudomonas palustris]